MQSLKRTSISLAFALLAAWPASAFAQPAATPDAPKGTGTGVEQASKGATDVTSDTFQARDKDGAAENKDATELSLSLGSLTSSGNSRLIALTTMEKFRLRRDANQFKAAFAGNYGRSALPGGSMETTVQNLQGLARYDRFLGDFSLFFSSQARSDKFQGLALRLQEDPGVAYYMLNRNALQLWTEIGYDLLYDLRRKDSLIDPDTGAKLDRTRTVHSGRLFLGYEHALSEDAKLSAGVEFIQGISKTDLWRLNGDAAIQARILGNLSIALSVSEKYESVPLPGKEKLDTTTAASLVYTLL